MRNRKKHDFLKLWAKTPAQLHDRMKKLRRLIENTSSEVMRYSYELELYQVEKELEQRHEEL